MSQTTHPTAATGATPGPGQECGSATARAFFDRGAPAGYLEEWVRRLARPVEEAASDLHNVVIFRLNAEWLALPTVRLAEITDVQPVHSIPHRTNEVLAGLVNIRGNLRLCVVLHGLLGVDPPTDALPAVARLARGADGILRTPYRRMVIVRDGLDDWVFAAEEVLGIHLLPAANLRPVPATFLKGSTHTRAVFDWHGHTVGLLDAESLFHALRSYCQ